MRIRFALTALALPLVLLGPPAQATGSVTVVAVGDIMWQKPGVSTANQGYTKTGSLAVALAPSAVLIPGDVVYPSGTDSEFAKFTASTWSPLLSHTYAVPGNHEWRTANALGYRNFVRANAIPYTGLSKYWFKARIGSWSVIGLDSERVSGSPGTAQKTFLRAALKSEAGRPTIVMWHKPRYSKGEHGNNPSVDAWWHIIANDRDVRLVLWGHDHNYERRTRTVTMSSGAKRKLVTITVGTGGAELRNCRIPSAPPKLICGTKDNYGVLKLKLAAHSFSWDYRHVDGSTTGKTLDLGTKTF